MVILPIQRLQMGIVKRVGDRKHPVIKPLISGFVATDQQDGDAAWIEGIEDAQRLSTCLHS